MQARPVPHSISHWLCPPALFSMIMSSFSSELQCSIQAAQFIVGAPYKYSPCPQRSSFAKVETLLASPIKCVVLSDAEAAVKSCGCLSTTGQWMDHFCSCIERRFCEHDNFSASSVCHRNMVWCHCLGVADHIHPTLQAHSPLPSFSQILSTGFHVRLLDNIGSDRDRYAEITVYI